MHNDSDELLIAALEVIGQRALELDRTTWEGTHFPIARCQEGQCQWADGLLLSRLGEALGLHVTRDGRALGAVLQQVSDYAQSAPQFSWGGLEVSGSGMLLLTRPPLAG